MSEQAAEAQQVEPQEGESTTQAPTESAATQTTEATDSPEESGAEAAWDPERAKEKIRKINSENQALRARALEAEKKVNMTTEDFAARTADLTVANLRLSVGYELGLPLNLATRLQGSTREELIADAADLVDLVSPAAKPNTARPIASLKPGATPSDITSEDAEYAQFYPGQ